MRLLLIIVFLYSAISMLSCAQCHTLIDDFNRSNRLLSTDGWGDVEGGCGIIDGVMGGILNGAENLCYSPGQYNADMSAFITIKEKPEPTGSGLSFFIRFNPSTHSGYDIQFTTQAGADRFRLFRFDNGVFGAQLGSTYYTEVSAGDKFGIVAQGTSLKCYYKPVGSYVWTLIIDTTDATYTEGGHIAFGAYSNVGKYDDLIGGNDLNLPTTPVFQDSFESHSDWSPPQPAYGGSNSSQDGDYNREGTGCPDGIAKYAGYRIARTAFTDGRVGHNTLNIASANARGGTGKAFTFYVEPIDNSLAEDWTNDGVLVVKLNDNYDTIYVRYYIKFSDNWAWDDDDTSAIKMGHMQHNVGGSLWNYFKDGDNWPALVPVFKKSYAGNGTFYYDGDAIFGMHIRKQSCYYPSDGYNNMPNDIANDYFRYGFSKIITNCTLGENSLSWEAILMDGQWHCIEYKLKGNSAKGVSDGEWLMYIDGHLNISKTDIPWADMGADSSGTRKCSDCTGLAIDPPSDFVGWNTIMIGGNALIKRYPNTSSTDVEQSYTIDDMVISTTYVGPDYVLGAPLSFSVENIIITTDNQTVSNSTFIIRGSASTTAGGATIQSVICPEQTITADDGSFEETTESWSMVVSLAEGINTFVITCTDSTNETSVKSITVTLTPQIAIQAPKSLKLRN